ncbi:hypothetical protein JCM24511_04896 [Saitozyma sp. JCM 24511]|nr:hypothetical protein JCM24511_04896 [Saitozyma sp. JCM 24511]
MRWQLFSTPSTSYPSSAGSAGADEQAPSSSSPSHTGSTSHPVPTLSRFEMTLHDEERYQDAQYPTFKDLPGCMQLFDEFMMCYALMPQLRNFYRHGEFRDCTWKFRDFKYCLSLKSESEEARRELWVKRKAEWWAKRRVGRSSEDVWDARKTPLENFPPIHADEIPTETTIS